MEVMELVLLGLIVVSIVLLFFSFTLFFRNIYTRKKIKFITLERSKSRRRKKENNQKIKQLENEKRSRVKKMIFLFIVSLILVASSSYMKVYISRRISSEDEATFAKAYYLVRNFEEQIELAATESEEEEKVVRNINYLATTMASYGIYKANYLNSEEGQLILNKYYDGVKELGVNHTTIAGDFYGNPTLLEETKADIERIKVNEKKVLEFYKINESVLEIK